MKGDDAVKTTVRELLRSGRLPKCAPDRIWAGYGSSTDRCCVCSDLVPPTQIVMEAVFDSGDEATSLLFHRDCFLTVESEWRRLKRASVAVPERAPPHTITRTTTARG